MASHCLKADARYHGPPARSLQGWIAGLTGGTKADPRAAASCDAVEVPRRDLERLSETSPHLLADIGVVPEATAGETSPWRLKDGRHLLVRPPL